VAWSTFITGMDPSGHGIFDFVHRDLSDISPYLSTSRVEEPETFDVAGLSIPLGEADVELLRGGTAFWEYLEAAEIPVTIFKVPANFPPDEAWQSETLSGMGTPDLLGTYGTFQLFSSAPQHGDAELAGGLVHVIELEGHHVRTAIEGPPNAYDTEREPLATPLEIVVDTVANAALLRLDEREMLLLPGEWTPWVPVTFDPGLLFGAVPGMVRFYLVSVSPHVVLYASPLNLDPLDPAMPISSPRDYAAQIALAAGRYYTQGMPEDTKALAADVLSDDAFWRSASGCWTSCSTAIAAARCSSTSRPWTR
jgi:hypothetical protein